MAATVFAHQRNTDAMTRTIATILKLFFLFSGSVILSIPNASMLLESY
jgi:hypothetical protein